MNDKYKELYKFFNENALTDLGEQEFYDTYSQEEKYIDIYKFMLNNRLTDLAPESFYNSYFEKKKDVLPQLEPSVLTPPSEAESTDSILPSVEVAQRDNGIADTIGLTSRDKDLLDSLDLNEALMYPHFNENLWMSNQEEKLNSGRKPKEKSFLAEYIGKVSPRAKAPMLVISSIPIVGEFVDDMMREIHAGVTVDGAAVEENFDIISKMFGGQEMTMSDVNSLVNHEERIRLHEEMYGKSDEQLEFEAMQRRGEDSWADIIPYYVMNPEFALQQATRSMAALANSKAMTAFAGTITTGMGVGAAAGAGLFGIPTAGVLALPGAGAGAAAGGAASVLPAFTLANGINEFTLSFSDMVGLELDRLGLDRTNENILRVLNNDESRVRILKDSATRGMAITAVDFLGGKLAGKMTTNMLTKGYKPLATTVPGVAIESTAGGAGEAVARFSVGQEIEPAEVLAEAFGEAGGFVVSGGQPIFNAYAEQRELLRAGKIKGQSGVGKYTINGNEVTAHQFVEIVKNSTLQELNDMKISVEEDDVMSRFVADMFTMQGIMESIDDRVSEEDKREIAQMEFEIAALQSRMLDVTEPPAHEKMLQERVDGLKSKVNEILAKYENQPVAEEPVTTPEVQPTITEEPVTEAQPAVERRSVSFVNQDTREAARIPEATSRTNSVEEQIGQPVQLEYRGKDGARTIQGTLIEDGQTLAIESFDGKQVVELGNKEDLAGKSILSLGLRPTEVPVTANADGTFTFNNTVYNNPNEAATDAITRDNDGNVVNVRLETQDGQARTFRGANADAIAYEIMLASMDQNTVEQQLEQLENEDAEVREQFEQVRAAEEATTQAEGQDTQQAPEQAQEPIVAEEVEPVEPTEPTMTEAEQEAELDRLIKLEETEKERAAKAAEKLVAEEKGKPDTEARPLNKKVNTQNFPLVRDKKTGKLYRRIDGSPQKGVSFYVPDGDDLYVNDVGIYKPTEVDEPSISPGIYMSDSLVEEVVGAKPDNRKTVTKPKKARVQETEDTENTKKAQQAERSEMTPEQQQLYDEKEDLEMKIEDVDSEIAIEKGNYKEALNALKAKISAIKKDKNLSKEEKEEAIADVRDGEMADLKDDYDGLIESYKEDKKDLRRELAAVNRRIKKAESQTLMQSGTGQQTTTEPGKKRTIRANSIKDLIKVNMELFGLNREQATYTAIIADRMIGAMALRSGKSKSDIYKSINWTNAELPNNANSQATPQYQSSLSDITSRVSRTMLIDTPEFQMMMEQGRVTVGEKSIHDFDGPVVFHSPDAMFSGFMSVDGRELIKGDGGVFYPLQFADENYFWASTRGAANTTADELNRAARRSKNGKVRLALTTGTLQKVFSNSNAARGVLQLFLNKVTSSSNQVISEQILRSAIYDANETEGKKTVKGVTTTYKLGSDLNDSMTLEEAVAVVMDKLNPDNSTFEERKLFTLKLIGNIVASINNQKSNERSQYFNDFFSGLSGLEDVLDKGAKKRGAVKITKGGVQDALARSMQEKFVNQLFADGAKSGVVYAVIEVDVNPDGDTFRVVNTAAEGRRSHDSYPFAIETVNGAKPVVHVLKDPKNWYDVANVEGQNAPLGHNSLSIFPTTGLSSKPLNFVQSETKALAQDGKYEDNSGTTQVATTTGSYSKAAKKLAESDPQSVLDYGAGLGLGTDAMSDVFGFDVDSYEPNAQRWKGRRGATFTSQADIDNTYDGIVSLNVLNVVPKFIRDRIVVDIYNKLNSGGKAYISTRKFKGDVANAKNSIPGNEHNSLIITRRQGGKDVEVFQKGFDGDELVNYIQELLGDRVTVEKDNSFGASGVVITKNTDEEITDPSVLFQDARAAVVMDDTKAVIHALKNTDVSSPLHELAHVFEKYLTDEERQTVMDWAGHTEWTRDTSEAFAEGFERFLFQGPTNEIPALESTFEKFKQWMQEIYQGIVNSPLKRELSPKMVSIYESMVNNSEPTNVTHDADPNAVFELRSRTWFENTMDTLKVKFYDKYWRVFMLQEDAASLRGKLPKSQDFMMAEDLMHGRTRERINRLDKQVKVITDFMLDNKITSEDLNQYLLALHAEERNEKIYIDQINKGIEEPNEAGSGMTTEEARQILRDLKKDPVKRKRLGEAVTLVRKIQADTQERLVYYGLESQERVNVWNEMYENYVPLHGFAADEQNTLDLDTEEGSALLGGSGLHVASPVIRKAEGRTNRSANALATTIHQAQAVIVAGEKNLVMQKMFNLINENPNPEVWGLTTEAGNGDHTVKVRINGMQLYLYFADKNYARAIKNTGVEKLNSLVRGLRTVNNWLRLSFTSLSPEFTLGNFSRDIESGIINALSGADIPDLDANKLAMGIIKNTVGRGGTLGALMRHNNGVVVSDEKMQQRINEFEMLGGKTGWAYTMPLEDIAKGLKKDLNEDAKLNQIMRKLGGPAKFSLDVIGNVNDAVENSIRLSAYIAAVEQGVSKDEAARLAKNITVNFNRSGEMGPLLNSIYMFFNSSIQGTARLAKSLGTIKPPKRPDGTNRNLWERVNGAQKAVLALTLFNSLLTAVNRAMSDEDEDGELFYDKIPDYVKERNLILMYDGQNALTIPMPYGYSMFANLGEAFTSYIDGGRSMEETSIFLGNSIISSFSPISFGQSKSIEKFILKSITPTAVRPLLEVGLNESYFGNSIYREQLPFMKQKAESDMGRYSPEGFQSFFKWLNEAAGGTEYRSSVMDINPDKMWHVLQYYIGGTGRFVTKTGKLITNVSAFASSGEWVKMYPNDIPFVGVMYESPSKYFDFDKYRENSNTITALYNEVKDPEARVSDISVYKNVVPLSKLNKEIEKRLKLIYEAKNKARQIKDYTERSNKMAELDELHRRLIMKFNKTYDELRGED